MVPKWTAAQEWCKRKGIRFKVINEGQILSKQQTRKTKKRISQTQINTNMKLLVGGDSFAEYTTFL